MKIVDKKLKRVGLGVVAFLSFAILAIIGTPLGAQTYRYVYSIGGLVSGRLPFVGAGGKLTDSPNATFNGSDLIITGAFSSTAADGSAVSYYIRNNGAIRMTNTTSTSTLFLDAPRVAYRDPSNGYNGALYIKNKDFILGNTGLFAWTSTGDAVAGTVDTALARTAAGALEVNTGTAGTYGTVGGKIATVLTGTAAPATTPGRTGVMFLDTANKKLYVATGIASSADWTILN